MEILSIVIEISILLIGLYLIFIKSYLTEKGKSVALKEDLDGLTREVESVKNEFIQEQEILKTDLQRVLSNEVSYRNEEREALIQFHRLINEWFYSIREVKFHNYNKTNIDSFINTQNKITSYYSKTSVAKSKIELLVEDKELVLLSSELYLDVLALNNFTEIKFLKLKHNFERQKALAERVLIVMETNKDDKDFFQQSANQDTFHKEEASSIIGQYLIDIEPKIKDIQQTEKRFTGQVKEYLKK